jgi:hypothetical protein
MHTCVLATSTNYKQCSVSSLADSLFSELSAHFVCLYCVLTLSMHNTHTQRAAILDGCVLSDNTAVQSGGSILVAAAVVQPAAVRVGGAPARQQATAATILNNCTLNSNSAASGGAVACAVDANVALTGCLVYNNTAVTDVSDNSSKLNVDSFIPSNTELSCNALFALFALISQPLSD